MQVNTIEFKILFLMVSLLSNKIATIPLNINTTPIYLVRKPRAIIQAVEIRKISLDFSMYKINKFSPKRVKKINNGSLHAIECIKSISTDVSIKIDPSIDVLSDEVYLFIINPTNIILAPKSKALSHLTTFIRSRPKYPGNAIDMENNGG